MLSSALIIYFSFNLCLESITTLYAMLQCHHSKMIRLNCYLYCLSYLKVHLLVQVSHSPSLTMMIMMMPMIGSQMPCLILIPTNSFDSHSQLQTERRSPVIRQYGLDSSLQFCVKSNIIQKQQSRNYVLAEISKGLNKHKITRPSQHNFLQHKTTFSHNKI